MDFILFLSSCNLFNMLSLKSISEYILVTLVPQVLLFIVHVTYIFLPVHGSNGFCFSWVDLSCVSLYLPVSIDRGRGLSCDWFSHMSSKAIDFQFFSAFFLLLRLGAITSQLKSCQTWKQKSIFTFSISKITECFHF